MAEQTDWYTVIYRIGDTPDAFSWHRCKKDDGFVSAINRAEELEEMEYRTRILTSKTVEDNGVPTTVDGHYTELTV